MNGSLNTQEEPGSTDNRLSLSPGDYPFVKDWEDGQEYTLTIKVQQQTSGEFAVVSAEPQEEAPAEETPAEDTGEAIEETPPPGKQGGMNRNPAMARLMASKKY